MQLSTNARKAVAIGLTLSTFVWSAVLVAVPAVSSAAVHSDGCLVLSGGAVWKIENGTRRGFTSSEVFTSHGYSFSQVVTASAEDAALPVGPIIVYADGSLVKGPSDPLVYLVANGQKRGFVSGSVFTGLGFSFSNVIQAPANTFNDLPMGANMDSTTAMHTAGVLVNASGTIYQMTATGKKGVPSMTVLYSLGLSLIKAVNANSADVAATNEGTLAERVVSCSAPVVNGSVNVSVSGPVSSTLIVDTTATGDNYSQASAPLANFVFSGSGTVTAVSLKRLGVSADDIVSNLYLFDGETRITDGASFSSGVANFTNAAGLFTVSGSKTIVVKADLNDGAYSGQTLGVELTSVTLSSGSVGGAPVSSNLHTTASASLASVAVGTTLPSSATTTDPGKDIRVWENPFTVSTRDVTLTRLALRQINSILTGDINNFRLLVDGAQVASTQSIDANGYVTFSGFSKTLITGTRTVKVLADVVGGSSRIIQMSLRNKSDVNMVDSQYGVNVSATGTFASSTANITVNPGTMTVQKASDSPSGNVADGGSGVKIGKWTFTAYGEPIKVETLLVDFTHVTSGDGAETSTLRNGKVFVNGSQVGSTTTLDPASTGTSFNTNFIVTPGTVATIEVYADMMDNDGIDAVSSGDKITATLSTQTGNGSRQISLGTVDVPSANSSANQVTVASGSMTLAASTNYTTQTITVPKTAFKLASWTLTGGSTEDVNISTLSLDITQSVDTDTGTDFDDDNLTDCYMKYGANQTTVKSTMTGANDDWSVNFTLAKNTVMTMELFCNIVDPTSAADTTDAMVADLSITGTGAVSAGAVTQLDKDGQTIAVGTGSLTEALGASNPVVSIMEDNSTKPVAAFKWSAANESYTITEIVFDINAVTTVQNVILKDSAGATIATLPASAVDTTFSGLSIPVAVGQIVELKVDMQFGSVVAGGGTFRENVAVTLDSYKKRDSQGVETTDSSNEVGNAHYVFAAIPTLTLGDVSNTSPSNSELEIYKFTVGATGGSIAMKQFALKVTFTDLTGADSLTLGDFKLFRDGTDITSSVQIVDAGGVSAKTGGTALADTGGAGSSTVVYAYFTFGSVVSDDFVGEEQISSSYTYTVRATPGVFDAADDDSFKVEMLADSSEADTYLNDADATDDEYVGTLSAADGSSQQALPVYLLWSDQSATTHDGDINDDAGSDVASSSTADWTNGYLVKNLPFAAENFTF